MGETVVIQRIGDRYGILVPQEHLDKLGWKEGDPVALRSDAVHIELVDPLADTSDGGTGRRFIANTAMKNYFCALRKLSKN